MTNDGEISGDEAARRLGVSPTTIENYRKAGRLEGLRRMKGARGVWRYKVGDVEALRSAAPSSES